MSATNKKPIQILMLEDNDGDAGIHDISLNESAPAEFALTCVATLSEALAKLELTHFDAVLCDLTLPDSQGLGTFIRLHAAVPELPIVVLSGLDDDDAALEAVRKGAQDYLVKGHANGLLLARSLRYAIERNRLERERSRLVEELKEALANVRFLRGLLPICAWCKKIRDDEGYWNEVDVYLSKHSDAELTHGICPTCAAQQ